MKGVPVIWVYAVESIAQDDLEATKVCVLEVEVRQYLKSFLCLISYRGEA